MKRYNQENIPFMKTRQMYVYIKGIVWKRTVTGTSIFSSTVCYYKLKNNFEHELYLRYTWTKNEKKKLFWKNE